MRCAHRSGRGRVVESGIVRSGLVRKAAIVLEYMLSLVVFVIMSVV